jgi:hypothetical protein|tara:strand:- start:1428 stop:1913 length:486 start_codon:yes stop_codon:yes gene_type:complete
MTSFVKSAKHIIDVDSDLSYVEIVYDRYISAQGYTTFTDYINTEPHADWSAIMSEKRTIPYDKFLDTMVKDTLEVRQRMAELVLENFVSYKHDNRSYVRVAHASRILDPTFQPPRVNMESAWQMEFIKEFCEEHIPTIIQTCVKKSRLEYFFNVLKIIELE